MGDRGKKSVGRVVFRGISYFWLTFIVLIAAISFLSGYFIFGLLYAEDVDNRALELVGALGVKPEPIEPSQILPLSDRVGVDVERDAPAELEFERILEDLDAKKGIRSDSALSEGASPAPVVVESVPVESVPVESIPVETSPPAPAEADSTTNPDEMTGLVETLTSSDAIYLLQVASLRSETDAMALADRLGAKGHMAYITSYSSGATKYYRVRIGFFRSRASAARASKALLADERLDSLVIKADRGEVSAASRSVR